MSPRTGRPKSENTKDAVIRCRVTKELNEQLENYCKNNNVTKSEIMIKGIKQIIGQK